MASIFLVTPPFFPLPKTLSLLFPKPITTTMSSSSWTCSKCTYLNSPSQNSICKICLSSPSSSSPPPPPPPPPPPATPSSFALQKWSCKACTFSNPYNRTDCEICGTRLTNSLLSSFEDLDSSIGSVFFPLKSSKEKSQESTSDGFFDLGKSPFGKSSTKVEAFAKGSDGFGELGKFRQVNVLGKTGAFLEPLRPCKRKVREGSPDVFDGFGDENSSRKAEALLADVTPVAGLSTLKILSYNIWFAEDLEMYRRMKAIGDLILQHSPDFICFQEVTPNIYNVFQQSKWWKMYHCSVSPAKSTSRGYFCMQLSKVPVNSFCKPFSYSAMGRELCVSEAEVEEGKALVVATSHLESPCPGPPKWDQMFSKERVAQAKEAVKFLDNSPNVIFAGDMNWNDKLDGPFPLPDGWVDAWSVVRPGEDGYTYDTKSNKMLSANRTLQKRLDRFICKFRDFEIKGIDMIGVQAIPDLSYVKEKKVKNEVKKLVLPVFPSDHFGLLLTVCKKR